MSRSTAIATKSTSSSDVGAARPSRPRPRSGVNSPTAIPAANSAALRMSPSAHEGTSTFAFENVASVDGPVPSILTFPEVPVQRTLKVGSSDDPLEREADHVADRLMHAPDSGVVQRTCDCGGSHAQGGQCDACRRDHQDLVQRSATRPGALPAAPASVHDAVSSPGHPLDAAARSYFEPRFGRDLSAIKVHTDAAAAESARDVNAIAYASGRDLVFDTGRYAPHATEGWRLLAHELTHVVQQHGADVIRRAPAPKPKPLPAVMPGAAPGDFGISRVRGSSTSEIFFAANSATLSADASTQIAAIKTALPSSVSLFGFSSADETATVAQTRADNVKSALAAPPNPVTVTSATGSATAQAGQADFPSVRKVEVVVGAAAPSTLNCAATNVAGALINPPKQACAAMDPATQTAFASALAIANDALTRATAAVAGVPSAANAANIDAFFGNHSAATLATLRTNLGNLQTHVSGLPGITSCGGQCDAGGCDGGSTIAYNNGVDAASTMTLCVPTFKDLVNDNDRARNLIHESAHGTSPLGGTATTGTADVAYRHERILFTLSPADRLRNSDSYALFALFLRERQMTGVATAVPAGIQTPSTDALTGFSSAAERAAVKMALAQLEKRLTWAADWMGQLYGQIIQVRTGALTWTTSWADSLMTEAARRFPLTAPPASPTLTDQTREAAILDRYRRMKAAVKRNLAITRMAAGVVTWTAGAPGAFVAADTVQIGPDFFRATAANQISLLLQELASVTRETEPQFIPAYVSLAAWIHAQNP
jgi:hypothetical protein